MVPMMSNRERRRSARLMELESKKDLVPAEDNSCRSKKVKTGLQDPTPSAVDCQVTTEVGTSNNKDHCKNAASMLSTTALPERRKLELLLNILKRKDRRNFFAEPVNPEEVEEYYDVIEEPMDFGTISEKLDRGMYRSLEEFEHDVFLVPDNAMLFNGPSTMYYRKASSVRNLAEKMFDALRKDPQSFESGISLRILLSGERPKGMTSHGSRGGRTSEYSEVDQPEICRPQTTENESIVSAVYRSTEQLLQHQGLVAGPSSDVGPSTISRSFSGNMGNTSQGLGSFSLMNALSADHNSNFFATRDTHKDLRRKPVQPMSDQGIGSSYLTNPFSGNSFYVTGNTNCILSRRLVPAMPDQQHTQNFFAGDGNPNFSAGWKTPNDANNTISTGAADPVIIEGRGSDLQREAKEIHGMSPSSYRWRPPVSGSTRGPANSTVGGCPHWLRPTQLWPQEIDLNKQLEQESEHTSSSRTSSRALELADIDKWLRPGRSQDGTNTVMSQNKSADGPKTFPGTLGL